jgi:hypothetical protein
MFLFREVASRSQPFFESSFHSLYIILFFRYVLPTVYSVDFFLSARLPLFSISEIIPDVLLSMVPTILLPLSPCPWIAFYRGLTTVCFLGYSVALGGLILYKTASSK